MDATHKDRDFIEFVVKNIVDSPEDVVIDRTIDDLGILITLKVAKDDMGKIIGKNGQTAKAIRVLLRLIGSKNEERVNLKILEPEGSEESNLPNSGLDEDLEV
ncbi:KH domain-containing protein [bacterium]|jgi:hypothetical protein|nr:KH domain-containing protein [bacterium]